MPKLISKEECIQTLLGLYKIHGKLTQKLIAPYIHHRTVSRYFGPLSNFIKEYNLETTENQSKQIEGITAEQCLNEIKRLHTKYGKATIKLLRDEGVVSYEAIKRRFGSMRKAIETLDLPTKQGQRKFVEKEEIMIELHRINNEFGYVSKPLLEKHSTYSPKIVQRIFGSFDALYNETGFKRNPSGYVATDDELKDELLRLKNEFSMVTQDVIEKYGKYSTTCYKDRFGSINEAYKTVGLETRNPGDSCTATWVINKFAEHLNEEPELEKRFDWLRNPKTNCILPIDAYFPNANVAIEYNGPQHYEIDTRYTTSLKKLEYRQWLDSIKCDLIRKNGIHIIVIHYKDVINTSYILKQLDITG